ncbi:undecaprenyl-diphosphate phosphatase [Suttonella ornithocola]|uniref:Undecaprenyl-diphosphatase n=1 Tax=Suttonella ornithocola TaxID=279832 RepID=A0A380MTI7_9GAMM|nr:undecaprenyl-diphosphate phosphatase [Suttonella ornithocola]SUO95031.1 Undecaprenyl-diphosphatase [Suttonella ornithocola]
MDLWQAFILSLIQGITEFLPISSSGHLVITRDFLHWPDTGVAFDAFTGLGTLTAVILYFRKELFEIAYYWLNQFSKTRQPDPQNLARLGNQLILATLPALILGYLLKDQIDQHFHSPQVIAITTIFYGILLGTADWLGRKTYQINQTSTKQALIYGFAQALALIPGTSRSGITMTAGLAMGFSRHAAARYSFLLSIPISAAAGLYGLLKLIKAPSVDFSWQVISLSYLTATISAFICIALFLRFLNAIGMWPHVIYRLILGSIILIVL